MMSVRESMNQKVLKYQLKSFEKLPVKIWNDSRAAAIHVAQSIALAIRQKQQEGEKIVLGLATGSTPISVYNELVRMHKEEGLSFQNVVTFNLDEYYPMAPDAPQSYVYFMNEYLFNHVDILPENVHIPDGTVELADVGSYCEQYEKKIKLDRSPEGRRERVQSAARQGGGKARHQRGGQGFQWSRA